MSNVKTSEVIASSSASWEDAVRQAVERANKTLVGLKEVEITRLAATVKDGRVAEYRAELKIHFILDSEYPMHE
jgi:flavin-binding protein dodecin